MTGTRYSSMRSALSGMLAQFLRAASERQFDIVHCFMPEHVHLIVSGLNDDSDARSFIGRAKQYSVSLQA